MLGFFSNFKTLQGMATSPNDGSSPLLGDNACVTSFVEAITSVVKNKSFRKEHFKRHKLYLAESYCLLWNYSGSGGLDRVKLSQQVLTGAYAAILLDLVAAGKIELKEDPNSLCEPGSKNCPLIVHVIDATPTYSFIDQAVLNELFKWHNEGRSRSVYDWLSTAQISQSVSSTLKNLISRGILGDVHTTWFGLFQTFPTVNMAPVQCLEMMLKNISLKEKRPDSYMLALLTLSRTADNYYSYIDPFLERHFSKREYKVAKENIKTIVETQGMRLKSPKFVRKKFSVDSRPATLQP